MSISLQAERLIAGAVEYNENVILDSIVISDGNISYDNATGVITIQEAGRYEFDLWVAHAILYINHWCWICAGFIARRCNNRQFTN